jgi:hypothetical protein
VRSHDLNRLLDEPGPEARASLANIFFGFTPEAWIREQEVPDAAAQAAKVWRIRRFLRPAF